MDHPPQRTDERTIDATQLVPDTIRRLRENSIVTICQPSNRRSLPKTTGQRAYIDRDRSERDNADDDRPV